MSNHVKSFLAWSGWVIVLLAVGMMAWQLETRENPVVTPVAAPGRQHVQIYFQSQTQPVEGYVELTKIMIQNGGVSLTPVYDKDGRVTTYINYARVDVLKLLPD